LLLGELDEIAVHALGQYPKKEGAVHSLGALRDGMFADALSGPVAGRRVAVTKENLCEVVDGQTG